MTPEQVREAEELVRRGWGRYRIARHLGISEKQARKAIDSVRRDPSDAIARERERARAKAQEREMRRLVERRAVIEEWRDAIREAALTVDPPPTWDVGGFGPGDEETAVLILSDVHYGQSTPARINAGWTHTPKVVERQFEALARAVLKIWDLRRQSMPWRNLVILRLGDMVDGDGMRASQARQVEPIVVKQTAEVARLEAAFIQACLQAFDTVRVESVPGNHARTSPKPGVAGLAELDPADSYDWLSAEFLRATLAPAIEAGRVEIKNHESYWAVTDVMGHRVILEHGSSLRGGGSWGGLPYYSIDRAAAAYRELEGPFTVLAFGHYHRPYVLPAGFGGLVVGNGSFAPTTPFVAGSKHRATRPSQTLLSIHPRKGVTMITHLYLDTQREAAA